jgi:hypothetical protein
LLPEIERQQWLG